MQKKINFKEISFGVGSALSLVGFMIGGLGFDLGLMTALLGFVLMIGGLK